MHVANQRSLNQVDTLHAEQCCTGEIDLFDEAELIERRISRAFLRTQSIRRIVEARQTEAQDAGRADNDHASGGEHELANGGGNR